MWVEVFDPPMSHLPDHAVISISFPVETILRFEETEDGLSVGEVPLAEPYWKDFDAIEPPLVWAQNFDLTNWGLLGAFADERRVGGAVIAFDTPGIDMLRGRRDLAVLWDLRIDPEFRRRGIGRALFRAAEEWAVSRGCTELRVETQNTNVPACRFYESLGCELREINPGVYPALPDEMQLVWSRVPRAL